MKQCVSPKFQAYKEAGIRFLEENKRRPGVKVLPCGVQYEVIVDAEGRKPNIRNQVKVHYKGYTFENLEFDNSYARKRPEVFGVGEVIKGWSEALKEMAIGAKWIVYIPYQLGYGNRVSGKIKPYSALVFEIELIDVIL